MNFLIRLKSWQLFFLMMILTIFSSFSVIQLFCYVLYLSWIYAIGTTMHSLLPEKLKPNITYFKISCLIILCLLILSTVLDIVDDTILYPTASKEYGLNVWIITIPFLLFVAWNMFYICMFAARMLESMIEGYAVNRSDSLKAFFCLIFFPFGVWYIQPALKRVLDKYETKADFNTKG